MQEVLIKFIKPVFIEDVLVIEGTIVGFNNTFKRLVLKVVISNQNGQKVLKVR